MAKKNITSSADNNAIPEILASVTVIPESSSPRNSRGKRKRQRVEIDNALIIPTKSSVPFQGVPLPYTIDWEDQISDLEEAMNLDKSIFLFPLVDARKKVSFTNLSPFGVEMKVMKIIDLPDGRKNAFLIGQERVSLKSASPFSSDYVFLGTVQSTPDELSVKETRKFEMVMRIVNDAYETIKSYFADMARVQMSAPRELQEDMRSYLNFIIVTSPIDYADRCKLLNEGNLLKRAEQAYVYLENLNEQINLRKEIFSRAASGVEKEQRDHFLRQQIREIQNEIGEGDSGDIANLENRAQKVDWPEEAKQLFYKELSKLSRYSPASPDYAIQYTYLDTLLNLPWNKVTEGQIDVKTVEDTLEKDHYGMTKVKERIVEHIAVMKMRGDMRSPILCLYGPPGVGKTSLCKSIAESMGREYARISLGGLHDETQIRGHRRTYVGALPGRIIAALGKLDTNNPVFVLDEVDKIGNDHRGDPAQALLEVLDPEQNSSFHDNYLDTDYDLSKIFFIATANNLSGISTPLLDRMELIEISGYLLEEKKEIAKRHLIAKLLENHGFKKNEIKFSDEALDVIILSYTRESGVRKLEKTLAKILRKIAVLKTKGLKYPKTITASKVVDLLGKEEIVPDIYDTLLPAGVAAGLAWTSVGGEILYFESALSEGKGTLTLTGNLGDVMKESATIALQWLKSNASKLGIDKDKFAKTDVHLHVPEGAVPKDGPSAGITMITSLASAFTGVPAKEKIAMTGEATLSGRVLPVGGVKEKILAAKRAGITDIILSDKNRKDIEEIEQEYLKGLQFHYVKYISDVMNLAFPRLMDGRKED